MTIFLHDEMADVGVDFFRVAGKKALRGVMRYQRVNRAGV